MAEAPWLDDSEQRTWRSFLAATRLLFEALDRDLQRGAGMPTTYYALLVELSEAPDRTMRMSDLAERLRSSRSRMSHAVARLEENGWVRRESCPTDRRGSFAVLTDEGMAALEAAAPIHVASVRTHLLDQLTPAQLAQLGEVSELLLGHLATEAGFATACDAAHATTSVETPLPS
jgi:DNA-binding MarR family transcriptional regulator